jgi:hypothetical protein
VILYLNNHPENWQTPVLVEKSNAAFHAWIHDSNKAYAYFWLPWSRSYWLSLLPSFSFLPYVSYNFDFVLYLK